MVFGKEVHEWGWPKLEDGAQLISDDLVEAYEMFYSENYRDTFFLTDSNSKLSKSPFFRTGFNGLMDGINERLKKVYSEKKLLFYGMKSQNFQQEREEAVRCMIRFIDMRQTFFMLFHKR